MTPQRPALAEVLATLTGKPPLLVVLGRACGVAIEASRVGYRPQSDRATTHGSAPTLWHRWTHDSPAEAVEALATARLWPWEPGDEAEPRWWCRRCGDPVVKTSDIPREASAAIQRAILGEFDAVTDRALRLSSSEVFFRVMDIAERATCVDCGGTPHGGSTGLKTPALLGDVVAVASLGAPQLARYVHLAGEIARAVTYGNARVVWRVMAREAIVAWAVDRRGKTCRSTADLVVAMAVEGVLSPSYLEGVLSPSYFAIPHAMPWAPALRSLAIGDEATPQPTGVHLVGLDASGIVLAVEAL